MKSLLLSAILLVSVSAMAQRPSPAATVKETLNNGTTVSINYSQPSVKGRTIGTDLEPMEGKVWRTGANEATVFETDKDIKIEGQSLPAGKYGLFTIMNGNEWTIIFNKTWKQWGAFSYKEAEDALRVKVNAGKTASFAEKMTFEINKDGKVSLSWGDILVIFNVN